MSGTLREMLAEAIGLKMAGAPEHGKYYRKEADAALATFRTWLAENGLVVVPGEATASMLAHASLVEVDDIELTPTEYRAAWQAMISAAPVTGLEGETGGE